jgi:hypothetical protein
LKAQKAASLFVAALLAAALLFLPRSSVASADAAPSVNAYDARCWRSMVVSDDLLCILRYQLPIQTTTVPTPVASAEAWCAQLIDQTGCTGAAVSPSVPTNLILNRAWVTLCRFSAPTNLGCLSATSTAIGVLLKQAKVPRVGDSVAGLYFGTASSGITWGESGINMCIESDSSFAPATQDCVPVSFNPELNTNAAQVAKLVSDITVMVVAVEQARSLPQNSFVVNNKLTTAGRTLALEAFPVMDRIAPDAFQAVANAAAVSDFRTAVANSSALSQRLQATAAATSWVADFQGAGQELLGVSGGFMATLIFLGLGLAGGGVMFAVSKSAALGAIALGSIAMLGMFIGGPTVSVIAVTAVILATIGGWFVLSKIPTG